MSLSHFHPIVAGWFEARFVGPTEAQRLGWPHIAEGRNTLIAAPTGSGKTLAAFLWGIDRLLRQGLEGKLADETQVVYVSPLKALSHDVRRNLEAPLAQIREAAAAAGCELPPLRVMVRTGDTPGSERQKMARRPPHILVTTPESLYLLLTSVKGRQMLGTARTVIVDEIHALARDKRGSHLALSLERLEALGPARLQRVGLSATQRPIDEIARFLVGARSVDSEGRPDCAVVDVGHMRQLDVAVEIPPSELSAVCSHETWQEIYERLADLIRQHRSTLVFVNTRRLAERLTRRLSELLGDQIVAGHHGSLSRETRLSAEQRLQNGELKVIVATASLELGIDIGYIDLVCQVGSPRSIATFLQRVGRSGHSLGALPKGRLFALTRDELLECLALVRAVRAGRLDAVEIPTAPLDILAQQVVASVACEEWREEDLFELCRRAWPYHELDRRSFDTVIDMLSEGIGGDRRHGAYLHRDRINGRLRGRRGARLAAITSGGAIPETADYRVVTEDDRTFVGTLNEDFAIESQAGDVFLLGNTSWRVLHVRGGEVLVRDAKAAPATIPFWLGEAPGRTIELSAEVSSVREEVARRVGTAETSISSAGDLAAAAAWLEQECGAGEWAARQAAEYVAAQQAAMGLVPTQGRIVFERFFDESGGMQLVIHAPLGARINRAWGLALRKRFCRSFDFELQASADDNGIVLSLGPQHSFPLEQMFGMLNPLNGRELLVQALLAVPMFRIRWRWNVTRALAVLRQRGGQKVPPPMQRFRSDDLLTKVFPAQTACQENVVGDIEVPDHPLVSQTVWDCLHEAMDLDRWLDLLRSVQAGRVELVAKETREPSPFSHQILNANPYAFLDDAPLEERRARAVQTRRTLSPEELGDLSWLDPEAIARVRSDAWPVVRSADELHDCLLSLAALPADEASAWAAWHQELVAAGRATQIEPEGGPRLWVAAESWPLVRGAYPQARACPPVRLPPELEREHTAIEARAALVRGRLELSGPVPAQQIAAALGLDVLAVEATLEALEGEGAVLRGRFSPPADPQGAIEWCDRRLLARIHRLTLHAARERVEPAGPVQFWRFLLAHQHVAPGEQLAGRSGLREIIAQLQGFETPVGAWERDILPARLSGYDPAWLDELALAGEACWGRLQPPRRADTDVPSNGSLSRAVPVALVSRADLNWLLPPQRLQTDCYARSNARLVLETLREQGALFVPDLLAATSLLNSQLEEALRQLAYLGLVTSDGFAAVRGLVSGRDPARTGRRRGRAAYAARGGRWSLFPGRLAEVKHAERIERWATQLLRRYGVMFRDLVARETAAPSWRELAAVYRRWEAQGRIRGGRFVTGVAGEQFADAAALDQLRRAGQQGPAGGWIVISACDPLNLAGILVPGPRIAPRPRSALCILDGRPVATCEAGQVSFVEASGALGAAEREPMARALRMATAARQREAVEGPRLHVVQPAVPGAVVQ